MLQFLDTVLLIIDLVAGITLIILLGREVVFAVLRP